MRNWLGISSLFILLILSCESDQGNDQKTKQQDVSVENARQVSPQEIQGKTQGTTFVVKTSEDSLLTTPQEISDLLAEFDQELSGYIDTSLIARLNKAKDTFDISDNKFFTTCYKLSQEVFEKTGGAFDPSVFPLVEKWGFFKDMTQTPTKEEVDSILRFVGFGEGELHLFKENTFIKKDPRFKLDFNAIAQGQSVDVITQFLDEKGHENYFVEVGGELAVKGKNLEGASWVIGIDLPKESNDGKSSRQLENYLSLDRGAIATSGNYRKFYEKEGKKYSHTLDPKTGFPVDHHLLSATVWAENAALADAYATAFMVMGVDETLTFIKENSSLNLQVYLLFENQNRRVERAFSDGMQQFFYENR